jgi:glycosyltransferase involved in cell wall biosynthesis
MKVNHITSYPPWKGGIADYAEMLIDELEDQGVENRIISFKQAEGENVESIMEKTSKSSFLEASKKAFEADPDVIHIQHELNLYGRTNFILMALKMLQLKRKSNAKVVTTMHTYIDYNFSLKPKQFLRYIGYKLVTYRLIFALSDKIIVHNDVLKEKMNQDDIEVIPHGVKKIECGEDIREEYGLSDEDTFLLCTGFLSQVKGFEHAVKAMKHLPENYKLLVTGSTPPNFEEMGKNYKNKLENIVEKEELENQVTIKEEFIPEEKLDKLICSADINLFPYIESSQSGMMHRTIGAGKNILCSDLEVFKSVLGEAGTYFEPGNPEDLAQKITNHRESKEVDDLREEFSWENVARKHEEVYRKL